jgi:predicted nucleic-acid-binding Zn-ribbon protein
MNKQKKLFTKKELKAFGEFCRDLEKIKHKEFIEKLKTELKIMFREFAIGDLCVEEKDILDILAELESEVGK